MASVNKVILLGNLGRDPETRYTTGGDAVTNLNIATSEQWKDKSGEKQENTEWHRVVLFGRQAEIAGEYLKKGRSVYIEGRLQTRKYTDKDGVEKYSTEIVGDRMQLIGGGRDGGGGDADFGGGRHRPGVAARAARAVAAVVRRRQARGRRRQEERRRLRRRHSVLNGRGGKRAASVRQVGGTDVWRRGALRQRVRRRLRRRGTRGQAGDDAAAQAHVAVVEHEVLPRRRRPLRRVEGRGHAVVRRTHRARRIGHPVARLRRRAARQRGRRARDPVQVDRVDLAAIQQRMVVPLHDDQRIARGVLARDEPRRVAARARAADAQALPLPERVVREPLMPPTRTPSGVSIGPGVRGR